MKFKELLCLIVILTYCKGYAHTKVKELEEKLQQLTDFSANEIIVPLNLNRFKEYVNMTLPRDYSFIIMFTAMAPSRRCAICQHVYDEYLILAHSFRLSPSFSNKMFFGIVDFDDGSDIFQLLRLNTAPVIMHFPAKGKPKPADTIDFEQVGIQAEAITKWIQERTDVQIQIFRKPTNSDAFPYTILFILIAAFLFIRRNKLEFIYNKQMWAMAALFFCFAMVSGQMWNKIRDPPFFHKLENGPVQIIDGSYGQLKLESYIIAILNGAVVVGMILMIEAAGGVCIQDQDVPWTEYETTRRRIQSVVGYVLVCVFFSVLLSLFRAKIQVYPFRFLFK